ncbi:MAG: hypothetical protein ACM3ML_21915 [Micromonosporaceae bacterium]
MPDAAVYGPPSLDRALGSLPVIASFLDQLNVAGVIDGLCPIRDVALATHGQVIEAMGCLCDHRVRRGCVPDPLGHDFDLAVWRL